MNTVSAASASSSLARVHELERRGYSRCAVDRRRRRCERPEHRAEAGCPALVPRCGASIGGAGAAKRASPRREPPADANTGQARRRRAWPSPAGASRRPLAQAEARAARSAAAARRGRERARLSHEMEHGTPRVSDGGTATSTSTKPSSSMWAPRRDSSAPPRPCPIRTVVRRLSTSASRSCARRSRAPRRRARGDSRARVRARAAARSACLHRHARAQAASRAPAPRRRSQRRRARPRARAGERWTEMDLRTAPIPTNPPDVVNKARGQPEHAHRAETSA